MMRGYCAVAADILHTGHINFLQECKAQCDELVVGVMTDRVIEEYKGEKPIMMFEFRRRIVGALKCVSITDEQDEFEFDRAKEKWKPDIIFDSEEHKRPLAHVVIPVTEGISSSQIKEKVIEQHIDTCKRKDSGRYIRRG